MPLRWRGLGVLPHPSSVRGVSPRAVMSCFEALTLQERSNVILRLGHGIDQVAAMLDRSTLFAHLFAGHVHVRQRVHRLRMARKGASASDGTPRTASLSTMSENEKCVSAFLIT